MDPKVPWVLFLFHSPKEKRLTEAKKWCRQYCSTFYWPELSHRDPLESEARKSALAVYPGGRGKALRSIQALLLCTSPKPLKEWRDN